MSCGGGCGGGIPVSVQLRLESVRFALQDGPTDFIERATKVFTFITDGADVAAMDAVKVPPVATGTDPQAVASRNALLFVPCHKVHGLQQNSMLEGLRANYGAGTLGELIQLRQAEIIEPAYRDEFQQLVRDLGRYGLHMGMTTEDLRSWVLGSDGPDA